MKAVAALRFSPAANLSLALPMGMAGALSVPRRGQDAGISKEESK